MDSIAFRRPYDSSQDDIDMTPMIDVVFQLLIFFMVTAAFGLQKALDLPRPEAKPETPESATTSPVQAPTLAEMQDDGFVVVKVRADHRWYVDDRPARDEQDLLARLRTARRGTADASPRSKLLVVAHGGATHEAVVKVLDAGASVGMDDVRLSTKEGDW